MEDRGREKRKYRRLAAALKYDPEEDGAPRVVASGRGLVAENIIARAREAGLPIQEDPDLAAVLCRLELGQEIPPELYEAVARILAFLVYADGQLGKEESNA
ncbi:MAG: EscU/YscU/HrcU family type III secretion system export apparatus switch protein [bacterium]|jgi:flagellar biosynthesis protein|nr:EscU/YscU/HrcU family type III secretion system export apparatus switch protein [Bacillota bacterium]HHW54615.1 FhlB domain-containing protein [Bacillota bacterium]